MLEILKRPLVGYGLSALLLTGILAGMVYDRVQHLRHGREIVLNIRPVDPRDLFKGDYVRLAFDISRLQPPVQTPTHARGEPVFALLAKGAADGDWTVMSVTAARPAVVANQIALHAKLNGTWLTYGIERYYVPEGTGPKLEAQARSGKLAAIVAVDAKGRTAIKGLMLDGKTIHIEPVL
jgi:uncharacterized membrane-anchored protein